MGSSKMERVSRLNWNQRVFLGAIFLVLTTGCSTHFLKSEIEDVQHIEEFEQAVQIKEIPQEPVKVPQEKKDIAEKKDVELKKKSKKRPKKKVLQVKKKKNEPSVKKESKKFLAKHLPELEDSAGFDGRRPIVDPFAVGEKLTLDISYFAVSAGTVTMEVKPFVEVNGEKAYHFRGEARSNSVFSLFYNVEDSTESFVSYKDLVPFSYALYVKESKQLKQVRSYYDWKNLNATMWEKKIKRGRKREKKITWPIKPFSQDVLSAFYYLRTFQLEVGKELAYRVAEDGKNHIVRVNVLREEKMSSPMGEVNTFVCALQFETDGVFKPVGDVLIWVQDSPRKPFVRIEAKIKLGTIVMNMLKWEPGRWP